jgi:hypothetical protein
MKRTLLFSLFLLNFCLYGQASLQWQKSIGGTSNDLGRKILQTSDNGYITLGYSFSNDGDIVNNHGLFDIVVVKLNSTGTVEWQKSYGGTGSEIANSIQKTADGGYIIAGSTSSNDGDVSGNHGGGDFWIIKISNNGTILWQKCLGGTSSDYPGAIEQTKDGGYIIGGSTGSNDGDVTGNHLASGSGQTDYWVAKLTSIGDIVWQKCYGSNYSETLQSIIQTADGGYIFSGETAGNGGDVTGFHGNVDNWVVKISSIGVMEWQKALGGTGSEIGVDIIQNSEGDYIVAGFSSSTNGDVTNAHDNGDGWVVKLGATGNIIWQKALGGTGSDFLYSVAQTIDGGYILAGGTTSNDGDITGHHGSMDTFDFWVIKLTSDGNVDWNTTLGGTNNDTASCVIEIANGKYTIFGYSSSNDVDVTGNHGNTDFWIANLSNNLAVPQNAVNKLVNFYPNPTKDFINVNIDSSIVGTSYSLNDALSRVVQTGTLNAESSKIQIDHLSNGIYFLNIQDSHIKIVKD